MDDFNTYFGEDWVKLSEDEHEYKLRFNDRYSRLFLTHIVAYQRHKSSVETASNSAKA